MPVSGLRWRAAVKAKAMKAMKAAVKAKAKGSSCGVFAARRRGMQ